MPTANQPKPTMTVTHNGAVINMYTIAQANAILNSVHAANPGSRKQNGAAHKNVYVPLTAAEKASGAYGDWAVSRAAVSFRKLYTDEAVVLENPATRGMWIMQEGGR